MKVLNAQSYAGVLTRCHENQHYKACVVFSSTTFYYSFVDELRRCYLATSIPDVEDVITRDSNTIIMFNNGSTVEMLPLTSMMYDRRYNEMLYDAQIDDEIIRTVLKPMLVQYIGLEDSKQDERNELEASVELDEFLNGFRIIPSPADV